MNLYFNHKTLSIVKCRSSEKHLVSVEFRDSVSPWSNEMSPLKHMTFCLFNGQKISTFPWNCIKSFLCGVIEIPTSEKRLNSTLHLAQLNTRFEQFQSIYDYLCNSVIVPYDA